MNVYSCGTSVKIKQAEAYGYITAICIRGTTISYEVSYFMNNVYNNNWFLDYELEIGAEKDIKIGYVCDKNV